MAKKKKKDDGLADVGMIGLGVMGRNLALNMADHGFRVGVYNRDTKTMRQFIEDYPVTPGGLLGCVTLPELVQNLRRPRKIVMLIKAGRPVDSVLQQLLLQLEQGDVVIDGGNSLWTNTMRRGDDAAKRGVHFVGSGVSGGEEGARFGPSLMPGGSREAWKLIRPIWNAIAAKVDSRTGKPLEGAEPGKPIEGGEPCTTYIGTDGAGHYVKMVHNGIEYSSSGWTTCSSKGFPCMDRRQQSVRHLPSTLKTGISLMTMRPGARQPWARSKRSGQN